MLCNEWRVMEKVDLTMIAGDEVFEGVRAAFPVSSASGTAATAVVYMQLEPGAELPEHRDSAEELLLGLEGEVEAFVDGESGPLGEGQIAVVPPMAPHGLRNVGTEPARVLGFFGSATSVSTFTKPFGPEGVRVFVIGAPMTMAAPLEETALPA